MHFANVPAKRKIRFHSFNIAAIGASLRRALRADCLLKTCTIILMIHNMGYRIQNMEKYSKSEYVGTPPKWNTYIYIHLVKQGPGGAGSAGTTLSHKNIDNITEAGMF